MFAKITTRLTRDADHPLADALGLAALFVLLFAGLSLPGLV